MNSRTLLLLALLGGAVFVLRRFGAGGGGFWSSVGEGVGAVHRVGRGEKP